MPLTNPNKIVTEERLSEFYGQILPYMGGMPEVLANKFSKSDLYSTDEKMIGVWTDGKPLYQKTIPFTMPSNNTKLELGLTNIDNAWLNFQSSFIYNANNGEIICMNCCWGNSTAGTPFMLHNESGVLKIRFNQVSSGWVGLSGYLTIQYTKTTDSAIAIGSDTDYSTDEKIVGTWIDGKPIWQNTVTTGGNVPSGATLILRTAMASTGYDTILYTK